MVYNLILDSNFKDIANWKFINCEFIDGHIISKNKVFGIEQDFYLADLSKLYLRWSYNIYNYNIKNVKIGFQINDLLKVNLKIPLKNKEDFISVVEECPSKKITAHIIFESSENVNKIFVSNPLLVNLNYYNIDRWPKWILDKRLKFMAGYNYTNKLKFIDFKNQLSKYISYEEIHDGMYVSVNNNIDIPLELDLEKDRYYLVKILFEDINNLGSINLKYGFSESSNKSKSQRYLVFKENNLDKIQVQLKCFYPLPYKVFLKGILVIPLNKISLQKDDIERLVYN